MPYMTCLTTALFLTCTCAGITLLLYAVVFGVYLCRHHSAAVRCSLWRCSIHDTGSSSRTPKSYFRDTATNGANADVRVCASAGALS